MIDLHMHSVFSDGTCTPEALIDLAVRGDVTAVALTDHDTMDGVPRFLSAAQTAGIRAVSGMELGAACPSGELHLLGYGMEDHAPALREGMARLQAARQERNEGILSRLKAMGLEVDVGEVLVPGKGHVIGRPHIAQALLARGHVRTIKEAFDRYLARGAAAFVSRRPLAARDAIEMIRAARGVPVLAHPFTLEMDVDGLRGLLKELREAGLEGLEAYYAQHREAQIQTCLSLCREFDLAPSGGSDYHGARTPDLRIGRGFGNLRVPDDLLDQLMARRP